MTRIKTLALTGAVWLSGLVVGGALISQSSPLLALQRLEPAATLLYASESCGVSEFALSQVMSQAVATDVIVIPTRYRTFEWAREHCLSALERLQGASRVLWLNLVPTDIACRRLIGEAQAWHIEQSPEERATPAWSKGPALLGFGFTPEIQLHLGLPKELPRETGGEE